MYQNNNEICDVQSWTNPALVQITAWGRTSDMPLSEPMLTRFTHICGTCVDLLALGLNLHICCTLLSLSIPRVACMGHQTMSSLIQMMALNRYPDQCWLIDYWTIGNKLRWKFNLMQRFSLEKKHLGMSFTSMSRSQCVVLEIAACMKLALYLPHMSKGGSRIIFLLSLWESMMGCLNNVVGLVESRSNS